VIWRPSTSITVSPGTLVVVSRVTITPKATQFTQTLY
jgi:hypothetical protein